MFETYIVTTAIAILTSLFLTYQRTRDPMCPLLIFTPMLLYAYVYHPYTIHGTQEFSDLLIKAEDVEFVLIVNLASITAFCAGSSWYRRSPGDVQQFQILDGDASLRTRGRFFGLSLFLGTCSLAATCYLVSTSGGPMKMLMEAKPTFSSASGYVGEMPMLTFPAIFLLAAAWQGRRLTFVRILVAVYVAAPQIALSILAKRRGTIFLTVATLAAFWYIVRNKKPNWKMILSGVTLLGSFMFIVHANRLRMGADSSASVSEYELNSVIPGSNIVTGDEFVSSIGIILTSDHFNHHYWGSRFLVTLFIRPIPSFLWESKWYDIGYSSFKNKPGSGGMSKQQWEDVVGFKSTGGSASGFVSDAFLEWSWGGIIACYCLGFMFSWLWKRWRTRGGVWTIIYLESLILSVFLPSQSLGAWGYRFALLAVPTAIIYRFLVSKPIRRPIQTWQAPISIERL